MNDALPVGSKSQVEICWCICRCGGQFSGSIYSKRIVDRNVENKQTINNNLCLSTLCKLSDI